MLLDLTLNFSVPELTCTVVESETTGIITVTWSFIHTGGLPLTALSADYSFIRGLTPNNDGMVINDLDRLTADFSNLVVGFTYEFTVTARNENGSSTASCGSVFHTVGKNKLPPMMITIRQSDYIYNVCAQVYQPVQSLVLFSLVLMLDKLHCKFEHPLPALARRFKDLPSSSLQYLRG